MRTRWPAYAGVSAALAGGVVIKALAQRPNIYSAAVYLSQSSANLMILTNFIFVTACTVLLCLQKVLYGPLRPIEIEQLYEKAWFAVTETCLAMTIFRGEIGAWFLVMFFALLAGKVWAWIGEGRVEILEQQPPRNPRWFHTRLAMSLSLSVFFDLTMLEYVVKQVMHMAKPDMMVMFGFEFAVLSIVSLSTASRYAINLAEIAIVRSQKAKRIDEIRRERIATAVREVEQATPASTDQPTATMVMDNVATTIPAQAIEAARRALQQPVDEAEIEVEGWEGKGRWIFYLDLVTDFFKLVVYLSFFFILLIFYGLPIHILRDVFMTFRSFFKRIGDFMRYRTATRDMNARYPDATEHDIGSEDVCIICREEMRPYQPPANGERANPVAERMRPKKLPCGHILHFSCLRSWLERQQICPTCRTNVVTRNSTRAGQNNGAADGQAGQHGNGGQGERQGPRIYQWGPLRIGIGAARGNVLEDLQQQLGDGQQRQPQQAAGDAPQQYGFGIRWDGLRRRNRGDRSSRSIQRQLDDLQRQISQEYRALGQMTNELRLLRNMETELARIRAQRQGGTAPSTSTLPGAAAMQHGTSNLPNNLHSIHALTGNLQNTVPAGSDQLPAGLTLPEGWSMMPLHPAQSGMQPPIGQSLTSLPGQLPLGPIPFPQIPPFQGDAQHHAHMVPGQLPLGSIPFPQIPTLQGGAQNHPNMPLQQLPLDPIPFPQIPGFQSDIQNNPGMQPFDPQQELNGLPRTTTGTVNGRPFTTTIIPPEAINGNRIDPNGSMSSVSPPRPSSIPARTHRQINNNGSSITNSTDQNTSLHPPSIAPSSPSTVMGNRPQINGRTASNVVPGSRPALNGTTSPPVASMFTLPSWGSAAMEPSISTRAANDLRDLDTEQVPSDPASRYDAESSARGQNEALSNSNKSKNPTVEDLVEDPDGDM